MAEGSLPPLIQANQENNTKSSALSLAVRVGGLPGSEGGYVFRNTTGFTYLVKMLYIRPKLNYLGTSVDP